MSTPGVLNNCLFYIVNLSAETGEPLLTTMRAQPSAKLSTDYTNCTEALLPPVQMTAPAGKVNCVFPSGLRYWYKVNKHTGKILPNSMFTTTGRPQNLCSGSYSILEYKKFANLGFN